jgi:hypothetical protein
MENSDPRSRMEKSRIRDPGWKKVGSGINIPDPQHCTAKITYSAEEVAICEQKSEG